MKIKPADRYSRVREAMTNLDRLHNATILLLGIGALGNEIAKNLVLLGVGRLYIIDFDHVDETNVTRSLLFRLSDASQRLAKCSVAVERLKEMNPDVDVRGFPLDCTWQLGDGVLRHVDAIVGAVDGWFPRWLVNLAAMRVGRPWVSGGISNRTGWVWGFDPEVGGCLECFLDKRLIQNFRITCAQEMRGIVEQGGVPTTPMTAAMTASFQVDAVLRQIGGDTVSPPMRGQGILFDLQYQTLDRLDVDRRPGCSAHAGFSEIVDAPLSCEATVEELFTWLKQRFDFEPVVDITIGGVYTRVVYLSCPLCGEAEMWGKPSFVPIGNRPCSREECTGLLQPVKMNRWCLASPYGEEIEPLLDQSLADCGIPALHILSVYSLADPDQRFGVELSADFGHWFDK